MKSTFLFLSVLLRQLGQAWAVPVQDDTHFARSNIQKRDIQWDWDENRPHGDQKVNVMSAFSVALGMVSNAYDGQGKDDYFSDVYKRYFDADNEWSGIYKVWERITGPLDGDRRSGPGLDSVLISNGDWDGDACAQKNTLAWADNLTSGGKTYCVIKLCDKAYQFPQAHDIKCDDLGDKVSKRMSTLSGILIHELTHCRSIGDEALGGKHITDHKADGYGPVNVVKNGKGRKFQSLLNADNYRWLATEMYWRQQCPHLGGFAEATDNQDFKECDSEDGNCTIQ